MFGPVLAEVSGHPIARGHLTLLKRVRSGVYKVIIYIVDRVLNIEWAVCLVYRRAQELE
jgi:hypothetical protein